MTSRQRSGILKARVHISVLPLLAERPWQCPQPPEGHVSSSFSEGHDSNLAKPQVVGLSKLRIPREREVTRARFPPLCPLTHDTSHFRVPGFLISEENSWCEASALPSDDSLL